MVKRSILILIAVCILLTAVFAACSSNASNNEDEITTNANLEDSDTEFGFETEPVTDEKGKEVTDINGKALTTEVAVIYKTDSKGNTVAQKIDENGEAVTDKKGNPVTVKSENTTKKETTKKDKNSKSSTTKKSDGKTESKDDTPSATQAPTATTKDNVDITKEKETTEFKGDESVPKTSASGKEVTFSEADQEIIASMLEAPYLYEASYENSDGVPASIANYAALWMARHEGTSAEVYPSNPVVLNLFRFFGQTVVNYKTECNNENNKMIQYNKSNDTFSMKLGDYPQKKQTVKINSIEDLGNNNFYKVNGTVSGAEGKKKVAAIIQKNRLDSSLGYSIKALKWS